MSQKNLYEQNTRDKKRPAKECYMAQYVNKLTHLNKSPSYSYLAASKECR